MHSSTSKFHEPSAHLDKSITLFIIQGERTYQSVSSYVRLFFERGWIILVPHSRPNIEKEYTILKSIMKADRKRKCSFLLGEKDYSRTWVNSTNNPIASKQSRVFGSTYSDRFHMNWLIFKYFLIFKNIWQKHKTLLNILLWLILDF